MSTVAEDLDAQVALVAGIVSVTVTGDPREAVNARDVAILIDPPTRDYTRKLQTWQLVILRNNTDTGISTTRALSEVLAELEGSDLDIEESKPGARRLGPERTPVPAYFVTYTTP